LLRAVSEHPAPATLKRLEHEYALEREPRSAWAAQPVALTEHQGRPPWSSRPGGESLDGLLRAPMELGLFLRVAVGLASRCASCTRRLIHKDIKPATSCRHRDRRVWLMGFGIASRLRRERQALQPPEMIAGSLPYMAPSRRDA